MVGRKPLIFSFGLIVFFNRLTVLSSCASPSRAKNSHWMGMMTESEALSALMVIGPSAGGESIIMKSNFFEISLIFSLRISSLFFFFGL